VDGTLTPVADSWRYYHKALGTWDQAKRHAELFFSGAIDYLEWARLDVGLWRGVSASRIAELAGSIPWRSGAWNLSRLKELGYTLIAITTGIWELASRTLAELGFDYVLANELEVVEGRLTGGVKVNVEYWGKGGALRRLLERLGIRPVLLVSVGDGGPDVEMFRMSDVAVAFNPWSQEVRAEADLCVSSDSLAPIIKLLTSLAFSAKKVIKAYSFKTRRI